MHSQFFNLSRPTPPPPFVLQWHSINRSLCTFLRKEEKGPEVFRTVFEKLRYSLERKNVIKVKVSFLHFNGIDDNHLDSEAYFSIDY